MYALFTVWFLNFSVSGLLQSGLETSSWRSPWVTGLKVKPSCSGGFDLLTLPVLGDTLLPEPEIIRFTHKLTSSLILCKYISLPP